MSSMQPPPQVPPKKVILRSVWSYNVDEAFSEIRSIIDHYPFVSLDTEFPGTVVDPPYGFPCPVHPYLTVKSNVNLLKLIQVGLTCSDEDGNLPVDQEKGSEYIYEFNLKDFDEERDKQAKESIKMLKKHGIDFDRNRRDGIDTFRFAELMMSSGLVCNKMVSWVVFHGAYDFPYLIKILTGKNLPDDYNMFKKLMEVFFGDKIYDVKHMLKINHGLEKQAAILGLQREVGGAHQAGSDSLITWRIFHQSKNSCDGGYEMYSGKVYGLDA